MKILKRVLGIIFLIPALVLFMLFIPISIIIFGAEKTLGNDNSMFDKATTFMLKVLN